MCERRPTRPPPAGERILGRATSQLACATACIVSLVRHVRRWVSDRAAKSAAGPWPLAGNVFTLFCRPCPSHPVRAHNRSRSGSNRKPSAHLHDGRPSTSLGIQRYEPFAVMAYCVCGRYRVVGVRSDRLAPRVLGFLSVNEIRNCHRNCAQDMSAPRRSIGCYISIGNVLKCTEKTGVQRVPNSPDNILRPACFFLWILTIYEPKSTEMRHSQIGWIPAWSRGNDESVPHADTP